MKRASKNAEQTKCTNVARHTLIKVEENRRKVIFFNEDRMEYSISVVDGCLIKNGIRADYLISKNKVASVVVELKGSGVEHACDQLLATVEHENIIPLLEKKIGFIVVCSKYPRFDSFVARAKNKCAKKYRAGFHVVCDQRELNIERVVEIDGPY